MEGSKPPVGAGKERATGGGDGDPKKMGAVFSITPHLKEKNEPEKRVQDTLRWPTVTKEKSKDSVGVFSSGSYGKKK